MGVQPGLLVAGRAVRGNRHRAVDAVVGAGNQDRAGRKRIDEYGVGNVIARVAVRIGRHVSIRRGRAAAQATGVRPRHHRRGAGRGAVAVPVGHGKGKLVAAARARGRKVIAEVAIRAVQNHRRAVTQGEGVGVA